MKHIAAIVQGNEFMLILPLADLYNLEIFLRGGKEPDPERGTNELKPIYDFDAKFPRLDTPINLQHAIVKELHQLASALKWLHEDLKIFGSSDRYLAHMDLKPENVLLVSDAQSPAGKWMLSDFGVSSFYKATNARVLDTPSVGDFGLRLTSRGYQDENVRGRGPYQPPEVALKDVDSRKCDVWSFSCVLCDVLAFSIGKTEAVYSLRNSRYEEDDYFYKTTAHPSKIELIGDSNTKLKSQIVDWWDDLEHSSSATWVIKCIEVLRKAMRIKPSDRPGIGEIVQGLSDLAPSIIDQATGTLAPDSQDGSSESRTNGLGSEPIVEAQGKRPAITISRESSPPHHERKPLSDAAPAGNDNGQSSSTKRFGSEQNLKPQERRPSITLSRDYSPQHHGMERLPDAASTGDDSGQSRAALHPEPEPPAEHQENDYPSSSSTGIMNKGATHIDAPHGLLAIPQRHPSSSADEVSPERGTAKVSIPAYRKEARIAISLPRRETVTAVAIAPSALQVAVLCKHSVHRYSTIDGGEVEPSITLSSAVKWTKIRMVSQYLAVYGLGSSHEKHVSRDLCPDALPAISVLQRLISKD